MCTRWTKLTDSTYTTQTTGVFRKKGKYIHTRTRLEYEFQSHLFKIDLHLSLSYTEVGNLKIPCVCFTYKPRQNRLVYIKSRKQHTRTLWLYNSTVYIVYDQIDKSTKSKMNEKGARRWICWEFLSFGSTARFYVGLLSFFLSWITIWGTKVRLDLHGREPKRIYLQFFTENTFSHQPKTLPMKWN